MNCNQIRELLPDLAAGMGAATEPEVEKHIASCSHCATHLRHLQQTMALLDEWQAPEPTPYFDTRLQARLREQTREEMARPAAGWFRWMRHPAWSGSFAAILLAGALVVGFVNKSSWIETEAIATKPPSLGLPVQPGTAVGDLQALDRNDELYADFDMLDQLQVQDDVTANP
ncbi:MAG: anti-sigma factor family protein [Terriglobales bacterium]